MYIGRAPREKENPRRGRSFCLSYLRQLSNSSFDLLLCFHIDCFAYLPSPDCLLQSCYVRCLSTAFPFSAALICIVFYYLWSRDYAASFLCSFVSVCYAQNPLVISVSLIPTRPATPVRFSVRSLFPSFLMRGIGQQTHNHVLAWRRDGPKTGKEFLSKLFFTLPIIQKAGSIVKKPVGPT